MFHLCTWNIIPDSVFAEGTVRSFSAVARSIIIEKMTQLKTVLEIEGYKIEFALSKAVLLQIMILNYLSLLKKLLS